MAAIKTYTIDDAYLATDCGLGEGPHYEAYSNTLFFVDIEKQTLHAVDLTKGPSSHRIVASPDISIGTVEEIQGNNSELVFAGKHGYGIINKSNGRYEMIKELWSDEEKDQGVMRDRRMNDGNIDSRGRFWAGTMSDPLVKKRFDPEGTLYRLDPDLSIHRMVEGVTIPNGISWTKDDKRMFFTDTMTKNIFAYDYEPEQGIISNKSVFFHLDNPEGGPDGHAMDDEEHLWVACYGLGKVLRISPLGKVVAEIRCPTRNLTCPEFAGEDLYITSAAENDAERYPNSARYGGNVFKCHVGVKGRPSHKFKRNPMGP